MKGRGHCGIYEGSGYSQAKEYTEGRGWGVGTAGVEAKWCCVSGLGSGEQGQAGGWYASERVDHPVF